MHRTSRIQPISEYQDFAMPQENVQRDCSSPVSNPSYHGESFTLRLLLQLIQNLACTLIRFSFNVLLITILLTPGKKTQSNRSPCWNPSCESCWKNPGTDFYLSLHFLFVPSHRQSSFSFFLCPQCKPSAVSSKSIC